MSPSEPFQTECERDGIHRAAEYINTVYGKMARKFTIERIGLDEANAFVSQHHRHHKPVVGHLFSIGAAAAGKIVGVAIETEAP